MLTRYRSIETCNIIQIKMYQLYGDLGSGSCAVEMTLAELGVAYSFRQIDLQSNSQRNPEYASLNPQRKVPALQCADGNVITESIAIILWLLETHSDNCLLPIIGSAERSQALRWLVFLATEIYPMVEIIDYPERFSPQSTDPESVRKTVKEIWRQRWLVVEQHVSGPLLLSGGFCVTDIYIAVLSRWAQQGNWRPGNIPKVETLSQAVASRPRCKEIWDRNFRD